MMGNLLPFWGWLLILALILVIASFEYGIRQTSHQVGNHDAIDHEKEIIAPPPPKIRVGSVDWKGNQIQYSIHNIGESVAIIKEINRAFEVLNEPLRGILPYSNKSLFVEKTIEPERSIPEQLSFDTEISFDALFRNSHKAYYFFGYIDYEDKIGNRRRTAFCRRFDKEESQCFVKVENKDYEDGY